MLDEFCTEPGETQLISLFLVITSYSIHYTKLYDIRTQIGAVEAVAPVANKAVTAVYLAANWSTVVTGSNNDYFKAGNWKLASGRTFSDAEERAGKAVCVIGDTLRSKLFGRQNPVGSEIRLKQFSYNFV